jgi:hypothetical protein
MRAKANQAAAAAAAAAGLILWAAAPAPAEMTSSEGHAREWPEWAFHQEDTVRRSFTLPTTPGARKVEIDNFDGAVVVRAHGGNEVALIVHQRWEAASAEQLERGRREVRLDISQPDGGLRLFVDGPFRSPGGGTSFHGWRRLGYAARFDFELEVPADIELTARTVEDGEIRVAGVGGRFDVRNVNGPVTLERMGGAGRAHSVNGPVVASFNRRPAAACDFQTVNGRVEAAFPPDLAADLVFKTLNGEVYTDFAYAYLPLPAERRPEESPEVGTSRHGGRQPRFHYRSRGRFAARIAAGGPELAFSTINGDILIRRQER